MTTYTLDFQFSQAGLAALANAQEKVCIVKSVSGTVGNVLWVTFKPFETNEVQWQENYGIYASSTNIQNGAKISRLSSVKYASKGHQYPFNAAGYFDTPNGVSITDYGTVNNYGDPLTFGLTQLATVNGAVVEGEINAATVLTNQTAEFTPLVTLSVFTFAEFDNGSVISDISSQALTLTYTSDTSKTVFYDDNSNISWFHAQLLFIAKLERSFIIDRRKFVRISYLSNDSVFTGMTP
ncbi:hypothetical protein DFA_05731 [Cavenderia fasciculata]|uniref:Uncharacterized protein n=1 Tax=Cavenderia fasciculata TaxID=261658 RepID=F4PM97_CACFS|nr:uncharacterized protein DFA_05731 [Cavenderia fasciculata]EGG23597.1 hypothetical protein DFA_05731 [Cavenderia fasciculata]|eukprot:XP_004361448.1 hypothetical protein DFA_05731 [Cavenderia fasciculata]